METLKKSWQWVVGVIGAIVGLLLLRNFFQKDLKAKAKTAETELKSAVIDEKLSSNTTAQADLNNEATSLTDALNKELKAQDKKAVHEAEDFWKKN